MRNRLWISFHIGTIAVLVLLAIADVVTWLRPITSGEDGSSAPSLLTMGLTDESSSNRSPAAVGVSAGDRSKNPLKTAQVGCETNIRLRVFDTVRQVRLQFDPCGEEVTGVLNATNGFEATIFGTATSRAAQDEVERASAFEPAAGTFTSPINASAKPAKRGVASADSTGLKAANSSQPQISTDYISLTAGTNQIKIVRSAGEQILSIERK